MDAPQSQESVEPTKETRMVNPPLENATPAIDTAEIPARELGDYLAAFKDEMFRALRKHFMEGEVPYLAVAMRLGIPVWRVERMLKGDQHLRLDQMVSLARALDARFSVKLDTFASFVKSGA